jgi:ribosome-binding protein aMBF1 (putative translation factor)
VIEGGTLDLRYDVLLALADGLGVEPSVLVRPAPDADLDPRAIRIAFGRRLSELRTTRCIAQETLARRTNLHTTAIGRYERGEREPRISTVLRLARGLGVQPAALLDEPRGGDA